MFDSEGVAFLQFLRRGTDGLADMRAELDKELLSDDEINRLADFNEQLIVLGQKTSLFKAAIATPILEFFNAFTTKIGEAIEKFKEFNFKILGLAGIGIGPGQAGAGSTPPPSITIDRSNQFPEVGELDQQIALESLQVLERETAASVEGREAQEKAMIQRLGDAEVERLRQMNEAREQFTDLFTRNMIQAADGAFDDVLKSWLRTLQQMLFASANSKLFDFLGGTGVGKGVFGLLRLPGFDSGGIVPGPRGRPQLAMVHGGETILPTHRGGGGFGSVIYNVDARGAEPGVEQRIMAALK